MKSKENKSSYGCLIFFLVMMGITYFEYVILILGIILIILAVYYFSKNKNNLNDFKNGKSTESKGTNSDRPNYFSLSTNSDSKEYGIHSTLRSYESFRIPDDVFELLWFGDGKHKNTQVYEEPSLIKKSQLKLGTSEPLGYYPSYEKLSPSQKYKYLNWLTNITEPIEVGYAFIFYYGLERHIIEGKRIEAVNMIKRLKKIVNNTSFQAYSNDALLLAAMLDNNLTYLDGMNLDTNPVQTLAVKYATVGKCSAIDIINASSKIGFTNKRYIKSNPQEFENILNNLLVRQFGEDSYIFNIEDPDTLKSNIAVLANYSLALDIRFYGFISVLEDSKTQKDLHDLLMITHEHVKELLKERRKAINSKLKEKL